MQICNSGESDDFQKNPIKSFYGISPDSWLAGYVKSLFMLTLWCLRNTTKMHKIVNIGFSKVLYVLCIWIV